MVQTEEFPSRIYAERKLMDKVKQRYPETTKMTYTGLVDWALRKLLVLKEVKA